jgi:hypothetical protein
LEKETSTNSDYLTIYSMKDWQIEFRVPVPTIIRYNQNSYPSFVPSHDGELLYVYNYNDRTHTSSKPEPLQYWISVFNLSKQNWLSTEINLPGCGASQMFLTNSEQLYVLCYTSNELWVIDTSTLNVSQKHTIEPVHDKSGWMATGLSSAVISDETIYIATNNREIHVKNPNAPEFDKIITSASSTVQKFDSDYYAAQTIVPIQPIGIDPDNNKLYVPTGTMEERSRGIATQLAVFNLHSGELLKTFTLRPFRWIAFSSDGTKAYSVVDTTPDLVGQEVVQINLQTGIEVVLLRGEIYPGLVAE